MLIELAPSLILPEIGLRPDALSVRASFWQLTCCYLDLILILGKNVVAYFLLRVLPNLSKDE